MKRTCKSTLAAMLAAFMATNVPAYAHNEKVHAGMVDLGYEVMKAVTYEMTKPIGAQQIFDLTPPANLSPQEQTDWQNFLIEISKAPAKYRAHPSGLPANKDSICGFPGAPVATWGQTNMGSLTHAVNPFYNREQDNTCGVWSEFRPGGVFEQVNDPFKRGVDFTGTALGFWAANVDAGYGDSHLWIKPQNASGAGAAKKLVNDATNFGIAILLAPFICLGELMAGNAGACWADAKDAGDTLNPFDDIDGSLPGYFDIWGDMWTGMWHHIKILGPSDNDFDDHQGLLLSEAGPSFTLDAVDLGVMVGMDASGMSVDYDKSDGPKNYESKGGDGSPATVHRSRPKWQFTTWPHTPFEPVDNLAQFGWNGYHDDPAATHPVQKLGFPLHALGDATVPMHVAGTPSWGHRPFEDASEAIWTELRMWDGENGGQVPTATQVQFVHDILVQAFQYRQMIKAWRAGPNGSADGIPVRQLVTAVATHTATYSASTQGPKGWPFSPAASLAYIGGEKAQSLDHYMSFPNKVQLYYPILTDGTGAIVAFLTAASEVL